MIYNKHLEDLTLFGGFTLHPPILGQPGQVVCLPVLPERSADKLLHYKVPHINLG